MVLTMIMIIKITIKTNDNDDHYDDETVALVVSGTLSTFSF